jgi:chromosome segregation ATPase
MSIEGFKTFAREATLTLSSGLTIVVGPNGCGKSNLIDAVAWAVGSRSMKSLRGEELDDVLFHGGEGMAPAGQALVRLVFSNADRLFPIDVEDLEVSREVTRGEGSRLFVNRAETRLRDVQGILAGTGLVGGFSLVRQGMVDKIILSRPEELGGWLEESANLAGFRTKKHEAALRLRRVREHRSEASRNLHQLKREYDRVSQRAAQARRKEDLVHARQALDGFIGRFEDRALRIRHADLARRESELDSQETRLLAERGKAREEVSRLQEELARRAGPLGDTFPPAPPESFSPERIATKVNEIRATGSFLHETADRLADGGPNAWPETLRALDRGLGVIRSIATGEDASPGDGEVPGHEATPLAAQGRLLPELRRMTLLVEELDLERHSLGRERSRLTEDRARLEERLSTLGPSLRDSDPLPDSFDLEEARRERSRIDAEIGAIGPVDETAAGRDRELVAEMESLAGPLRDLEEAERQLTGFIQEVRDHTDRISRETFARVQERFQKNMESLFEGGQASLRWVEPASSEEDGRFAEGDGVEAPPGVEVRIRLPRKKESSLTLLSGGERTLAGLALILALAGGSLETETSRLIILDEVDAALDEANVERFAGFLRLLSEKHQILCVTHNRLTMQQGSRLVGVTSGRPASTSILVAQDLPSDQSGEPPPGGVREATHPGRVA